MRRVGVKHLPDTRNLRRGLGGLARAVPGDEDVDVAADLLRRRERLSVAFHDRLVIVLRDN